MSDGQRVHIRPVRVAVIASSSQMRASLQTLQPQEACVALDQSAAFRSASVIMTVIGASGETSKPSAR